MLLPYDTYLYIINKKYRFRLPEPKIHVRIGLVWFGLVYGV